MTKEEVRVITLAKARLGIRQVVWDVGAGTGSISVEAALLVPDGEVYAIERNSEGISLIEQNSRAFNVNNVRVIKGEAPRVLASLPDPDRVIIGGSGGNLIEIVQQVHERLRPGGRVVLTAVTLETIAAAVQLFKTLFVRPDFLQVSISRTVVAGGLHLLKGMNPVMIISAEKGEDVHAG